MTLSTIFAGGAEWLPLLAGLAARATLVLLLAAAVAAALGRASAAARHLVWCVAVAGVLALPVLSALLPAWELPLLPAASSAEAAAPAAFAPEVEAKLLVPQPAAVPPAWSDAPAQPEAGWLARAIAWTAAAGVLAGLLWLSMGFWGVARLGRRAEVVRDPEWLRIAQDAAERLGLRRPVLLLRARGPVMPATWGLLWPSVVVPSVADQWPEERRRAVLAHELAHVKRFDCLTQALAQLACVLFWWHPAVWYAARRLRVERERACDDLVLGAGARASDYAAHLLEVARAHRALRLAAPALVSMARPSHLESRLLWVLDAARPRTVPSPVATALTVAAALLVLAPIAALRPTPARAESPASAPFAPADQAAKPGKGRTVEDVAAKLEEKAAAGAKGKAFAAATVQVDTPPAPRGADWQALTPDQLIELGAVGVTPAWLDEMRRHGYAPLTVEQAAGMRAVGVTGRYVEEMAAAGHPRLSVERITSLRALGVTPAYLRELREMGFGDLSLDEVQGMRAMGVTSRYVAELQDAGLRGLDAEALTSLKGVGVTGAYVRAMRAAGMPDDVRTLASLRAVGVTPEYIRDMAAVGLAQLSVDDLAGLRAQGVDAAYVREMSAAGFRSLTPEQLMRLRASGVDRELAESYRRYRAQPNP